MIWLHGILPGLGLSGGSLGYMGLGTVSVARWKDNMMLSDHDQGLLLELVLHDHVFGLDGL